MGVTAILTSVFIAVANPIVELTLRSRLHSLLSRNVMLLSMQGKKSGDTITIPVNYLREGNEVLCASDTRWWRNLEGGSEVGMFIQGQSYTGRAEIVEGPAEIEAGFRRLRPSTYERALRTGAVLVRIELD